MSGELSLLAARYWLAPHVHACLNGTHVVLLDLKNDRYLVVDAEQAARLGHLVGDWPTPASWQRSVECNMSSTPDTELIATLCSMLEERLITDARPKTRGKWPNPDTHVRRALFGSVVDQPALRTRDVLAFVRAALISQLEVSLLPIRYVVRGLERRRSKLSMPRIEVRRLRSAVLSFMRLRPFLFRSRDCCFLYCVALSRYLYHCGIPTYCVFGVQDAPFAAHCWLEHENIVLNDTPEHVSGYTPILYA